MERNKCRKKLGSVALILAVAALVVVSLIVNRGDADKPRFFSANPADKDAVSVYFIDVGQGNAALIQCGEAGILIDAGERDYADQVIGTIKSAGVKTLKYVIATHPHTDHIGALCEVLEAVPAQNIILPRLSKMNIPTTATYEKTLRLIQAQKLNVIEATYGAAFSLSDSVRFTVLGPLVQDENLNNMSVVCRMEIFEKVFLFPGDAELQELKTLREKGVDFSCDVMLMAHHGSSDSFDAAYLDAASPDIAIISCGANNDYGHPHREILDYLSRNGIETHRTDTEGTLVIRVSKQGLTVETA